MRAFSRLDVNCFNINIYFRKNAKDMHMPNASDLRTELFPDDFSRTCALKEPTNIILIGLNICMHGQITTTENIGCGIKQPVDNNGKAIKRVFLSS